MAKSTYMVERPIEHGEEGQKPRRYRPGDGIELEDEHAERLLKSGAVSAPPRPEPAPKGGKAK
jgi:hypothetical protein